MMCSKSVPNSKKVSLVAVASMRCVSDLGKYLGFQLINGRATRQVFNPILDKINQRLAGWKTSFLNRAGKLCFAKSVLTSIPSNNSDGLHLVGWNHVILLRKDGGLAIRDARLTNISLPGKLTWKMLEDKDCIILKAKESLRAGFRMEFSNGNTSIWYQEAILQLIRTIPIPPHVLQCPDFWCWVGSAGRPYCAKAGYDWLLNQHNPIPCHGAWRWIWHLIAPEKIAFLLWLILHDALPTRAMLHHRHILDNDLCPSEDIQNMGKEDNSTERNKLWWSLPPMGAVKLNVDGSCCGHNRAMYIGGVLRGSNGSWICGFSSKEGVGSALIAINRALQMAWGKGLRKVICESGSIEVVHLLHLDVILESIPFKDLLLEIRNLMQKNLDV
ncbi:Ribonuclease H-like superfamily [Sesbania bispinosa]|nr:Ribonuclease H-like superfamily [Sesbania bispinosa]